MSREFGEERGGMFFHQHIEAARDDSQSGGSRGAKVMLAFLEPLAEIAYAVSSEEACDSSESYVVQKAQENYRKLQDAMTVLRVFLDPSIELAANALAATMRYEVVPTESDDTLSIKVWGLQGLDDWCSDIRQEAIRSLASKCKRGMWYSTGSSYKSFDDFSVYHFATWSSSKRAEYLARENHALKQRIAYLEAMNKPEAVAHD
jgi:hypothetical protein